VMNITTIMKSLPSASARNDGGLWKTFDAFTRRRHEGTLTTAGGYGHRHRLVSGTRNNLRPAGG
jgi:hypothetical protein